MKKLYALPLLLLGSALPSFAAGTVTLVNDAAVGTKFQVQVNAPASTTLTVDLGDAKPVTYTINGAQTLDLTIKGTPVKFSGDITVLNVGSMSATAATVEGMTTLQELSLANNKIEDFGFVNAAPALKRLDLHNNHIYNSVSEATLTTEFCPALEYLNLSDNTDLACLDMRYMTHLKELYLDNCPEFASMFICMPEDSHDYLEVISVDNTDLAHFYPVSLPKLKYLSLSGNNLMSSASDDPFVLGDYPALEYLDVSGNRGVDILSVTSCPKLQTLDISNCDITSIDIAQNKQLSIFKAANNGLTTIDLGNNVVLKELDLSGNPVKSVNLTASPVLETVNLSGTSVADVNLLSAPALKSFIANGTLLGWVDFNAQKDGVLSMVDLRNNTNMTSATVDYTLHTLPKSVATTSANLLLEGTDCATANIAHAIGLGWKTDATGNGTVTHPLVNVTLTGAKPTGGRLTGTVNPLYPGSNVSMAYDFTMYEADGGKFVISQWEPDTYRTMMDVTTQARTGIPVHVQAYPEDGKRFKAVKVNGKEINSEWFVIDGASTVEVEFGAAEPYISVVTRPGQEMSFMVNTTTYNGTIYIDWGTGTRTEYTGQNSYTFGYLTLKGTRIDGTAAGETVTIYGDIAAVDFTGYGDVAEWFGLWDNHISSIDISNAPELRYLNLYWNPVTSLNLSSANKLEILDVSYTSLKHIDLSTCPNLVYLSAYSDGYYDDGIAAMESIDLSRLPNLQSLNVKGQQLSTLDVSNNPILSYLNANGNLLTSIDLSNNTELKEISLGRNSLTSIDVSNCPVLRELYVDDNKLTSLDVSNNDLLETLMMSNNDIHKLDLSKNEELNSLYINGNSLTAAELNDIYYRLPVRKPTAKDEDTSMGSTVWNLAVIQGGDKEGQENEARRADSSIAVDRQWTPSHSGTNGGSPTSYLDFLPGEYFNIWAEDAEGNRYYHGTPVPKYIDLTVGCAPHNYRKLVSLSLNGELPTLGTSFKMPGIYTKVTPIFKQDDSVEGIIADGNAVSISTVPGAIVFEGASADAPVIVYSIDGRHVINTTAGQGHVFVAAGTYIVSVDGTVATVLVR